MSDMQQVKKSMVSVDAETGTIEGHVYDTKVTFVAGDSNTVLNDFNMYRIKGKTMLNYILTGDYIHGEDVWSLKGFYIDTDKLEENGE